MQPVFCVGTYTGAVSDAELRTITVELHDRVRASSPQQQPRRGVLILERERRRPNGTKSACLRALQGRGREGTTCGGVSARLPLPARVHLSRGATEGTEFHLPAMRAIYPAFRMLLPNRTALSK
jgi:hypothetical protein